MLRALALASVLAAFGGGLATGALDDRGSTSGARPDLDLRVGVGQSASFLRGFDLSAMYPGAAPDQIRAIDQPRFDTPSEAKPLLPPSSLVVGLARGEQAHAYPIDLLSLHEVVNDVVGGLPVAVTWCPLCSSALAYERRLGGRVLVFGVSGYLYHANQILFDRQTGSLWSQLLGGAVTGRYRGTSLTAVPILETTWAEWLAAHPRTSVLSIRHDMRASDFTRPHSYASSRGVEESDQPYATYTDRVGFYFSHRVRGIADGSRVLGLVVAGRAKAYALSLLARQGWTEDRLSGEPVLLVYDSDANAGAAYSRVVRGRTLSFNRAGRFLVDRQTRSRWSRRSGRAVAGPLAGTVLRRLTSTNPFWFAWRAFHPQTAVER